MQNENNEDKDVKYFLGMPMRWEAKNMFKGMWNDQDDRIFPPKYFGIGWSVNFHALLRRVDLIKPKDK